MELELPPKGADPRLRAGRRMSLTSLVFVGGLALAMFGSRVLLQEIESQPDMKFYEIAKSLGMAWGKAMHKLGAAQPDRVLHDEIRKVEALLF